MCENHAVVIVEPRTIFRGQVGEHLPKPVDKHVVEFLDRGEGPAYSLLLMWWSCAGFLALVGHRMPMK